MTRQHLEAISQRLVENGGGQSGRMSEALRSWLIRASMWGPLAGVTATTLELLGDSAKARKGLFFLMPLVRWMSEPFLYPVETSGTQEQRIAEMERVFGFIRDLREQGLAVSLARGLKYAGRRFQELAGADNALARTMRGDFSVVEDTP